MRVVVTRPQADAERTAAALRARGHDVLVTPLMRLEPIAVNLDGQWSALAITSANAPNAIARNPARDMLVKLPLLAIGRRGGGGGPPSGVAGDTAARGRGRGSARLIRRNHPTKGRGAL